MLKMKALCMYLCKYRNTALLHILAYKMMTCAYITFMYQLVSMKSELFDKWLEYDEKQSCANNFIPFLPVFFENRFSQISVSICYINVKLVKYQ